MGNKQYYHYIGPNRPHSGHLLAEIGPYSIGGLSGAVRTPTHS